MVSIIDEPDKKILKVQGSLTFDTAKEFHAHLLEALKGGVPLEIHLEEMQSFDLAGIQVLLSVCRSRENITVIPGRNEERLLSMLKFAGILLPGCVPKGMVAEEDNS